MPIDASVTGTGLPERADGAKVTERFFDLWGVPPAVGRILQPTDFAGGHRVVVLGDALWARQFGRDPNVIGVPVRIDGEPYMVVGVMPAKLSDRRQRARSGSLGRCRRMNSASDASTW